MKLTNNKFKNSPGTVKISRTVSVSSKQYFFLVFSSITSKLCVVLLALATMTCLSKLQGTQRKMSRSLYKLSIICAMSPSGLYIMIILEMCVKISSVVLAQRQDKYGPSFGWIVTFNAQLLFSNSSFSRKKKFIVF